MPGLYIISTQPRAGKTLLACSLGVILRKRGYRTGYMKPLGAVLKRVEAGNGDAYALTVQEVLGQDALPEDLTPVMIPSWTSLPATRDHGHAGRNLEAVKKAYSGIAEGKDLMLINGTQAAPFSGSFAGLDTLSLTRELKLHVLLVERYDNGINYDSLIFMRRLLGEKMAGVVINDIPEADRNAVAGVLLPFLEQNGIPTLGMIAHDQRLNSIRSLDLAYALEGRIVAGNNNSSNLVEGFIICTMQMERFIVNLRANPRRAVIVGGDRADLQLAALQARAPCLILTGNIGPHELIRAKAEEIGIPLIVSKDDGYHIARRMSRIMSGQKFQDLCQIRAGVSLVEKSLDAEKLIRACFGPAMPTPSAPPSRRESRDNA
ncbi:MAG: AAA family ATPase [Deltaproteobacteria bacterium]|jgi:BioD-like phosphotransacetylase family protein|nr:AAA family ATPase [Deltaproteobacteria bacterium]